MTDRTDDTTRWENSEQTVLSERSQPQRTMQPTVVSYKNASYRNIYRHRRQMCGFSGTMGKRDRKK